MAQPEAATLPVAAIADRFGLGEVSACTVVTEGLMNPNWRLRSSAGIFAVKQLRDASPAAVRRQHRLLPRLAERGIPVPAVRRAGDGDSLAEIDGRWYAVVGWLPGHHRTGRQVSLSGCWALGQTLGHIHICLRELLPAPAPTLIDKPTRVAEAVAALDRFAALAAAGRDDFDRAACAEIAWRRELIDRVASRRPPDRPVRPVGWTHGDLNHLNLLFADETVSGVLDWDRLDVRPYGLEVVRSATLLFAGPDGRADLPRIAAFVAGYRDRVPISADELLDAAHRRWWTTVCDSWILSQHYIRQNRSCDHLLAPSSALLRWWTDHRNAVAAALTGTAPPSSG